MSTREQRTLARRLWLEGTLADDEIADRVGASTDDIGRWRDDENWIELRDVIDARAAIQRQKRAEDADGRDEILTDVLSSLAGKLMQRGAGSLTPADLKTLASVVETSRKIRESIRISRLNRDQEDRHRKQ